MEMESWVLPGAEKQGELLGGMEALPVTSLTLGFTN